MDMAKWIRSNSWWSGDLGDDVIHVNDLQELLKTHSIVPNQPVGEVQGMIRVDWANEENTKVIAFIDKDKKLAPGTKLYAVEDNQ